MKNKSIIILTLILVAFFTTSCEKELLNIDETDLIAGNVALSSTPFIEQALIGAYSGLGNGNGYSTSVLWSAIMTDEVRTSEFYNAATVHEWQFGASDVTVRDNFQIMPYYYTIIDRVNRVLAALPTAKKDINTSVSTDSALKAKIRAEALFIRAFCHFELYRFFSNSSNPDDLAMAYITKTDITAKLPRIKVGPYFELLKKDLNDAKLAIPLSFATAAQRNRANITAIHGLEARIGLYLKDYDLAISAATKYIDLLPISTRATFPTIWSLFGNTVLNPESGFILPQIRIGSLFRGTSASATNVGQISWAPSQKIISTFNALTDIRYAAYVKYDTASLKGTRKPWVITKFAGSGYGTTNENIGNANIFRTAEMYLIRAEAKAEKEDLAGAKTDLEILRTNRISAYTSDNTLTTKTALIDAILNERFKELAFEGHRIFDLKRRGLPVVRIAADLPSTNNTTTLPANNFRFLVPIFVTEIQANPNIQQNPGY